MVRVIEKKGKSVDEAIKAGLDELGCEIDDVSIEIIEEPTKGLLGIGKKPAVVKLTEKDSPDKDVQAVAISILDNMKIDYKIDKIEVKGDTVRINIVGNDMGLLIGRKGETLNSLQFIVSLIVNKNRDNKLRIIFDVEDYRKKKEESLESLALRLSDKVKKTQRNVVMRPMSSQERRVIHTVLQNDPYITTYSMGDEPNRKVVISLKK